MYRLLIVTGNQSVRDLFTAMEGWESLGFKPPRLRQTTQEALECMQKHQIDAIAVDDGPAFDELNRFVEEQCPAMLRFPLKRPRTRNGRSSGRWIGCWETFTPIIITTNTI